jgi:predicted nucleic acid-binding protein
MRVFLDANILFSASYAGSRIAQLVYVLIEHLEPVTDAVARAEAQHNITLKQPQWSDNLDALLERLPTVASATFELPVRLDPKDRPILCAAIQSRCDYLLTGDRKDFGHLFGQTVRGVAVVTPMQLAEHLEAKKILKPRKNTR